MTAQPSQQTLADLAKWQRTIVEVMDMIESTERKYDRRLPRIVVVGDQSVGKSSVLASITGIPFETDSDTCTRFATEFRLRLAFEKSLTVSIIPDSERAMSEQLRLRNYKPADPNSPISAIFQEARDQITQDRDGLICRDRLIITKSGPEEPLLTLVDLPGIVHTQSDALLDAEMKAIEDLAEEYMKNRHTIILCVIGGNVDYVLSRTLDKVKKFDPHGSRTIGVVTKPDYISKARLERKYINLTMNRDTKNRLELGWYVMLNPGPGPLDDWKDESRAQKEEEFFTADPWTEIPRTSWGAAALSEKLISQLESHLRNHLPSVRKQATEELEKKKMEQRALCEEGLETVLGQRKRLTNLMNLSNGVAVEAVNGTYGNDPDLKFFSSERAAGRKIPAEKLRSRVIHENQLFADKLRADGLSAGFTSDSSTIAASKGDVKSKKKEFAKKDVADFRFQNQSFELPRDRNPRIPYQLCRQHSGPHWENMAGNHLNRIIEYCNRLLERITEVVWPEQMQKSFKRHFLDEKWNVCCTLAKEELDKLLDDRRYELQAFDPQYELRFAKWEEDSKAKEKGPDYESELVLEQSLILYDILATVFIHNVIFQVVERHLMTSLKKLFESTCMGDLPEDKVKAIMNVSRKTIERRKQLKIRIEDLEEALRVMDEIPLGDYSVSFGEDGSAESEDEDLGDAHGEAAATTETANEQWPADITPDTNGTECTPSPPYHYYTSPTSGPSMKVKGQTTKRNRRSSSSTASMRSEGVNDEETDLDASQDPSSGRPRAPGAYTTRADQRSSQPRVDSSNVPKSLQQQGKGDLATAGRSSAPFMKWVGKNIG